MAGEPGGGFVGAIAAEKRQIDEGRDPQAHMVEPDQHPEPVVGEQAQKQDETEAAEVSGALGDVGPDRNVGPHRAVLVVPGRVRRLAQE